MAIATCSIFEHERAKYQQLWRDVPEYRQVSPGEQLIGPALAILGLTPGTRMVDVGCGTGRAAAKFAELLMTVTLVDATKVALDPDVAQLVDDEPERFVESCLWHDWPTRIEPQDVAYCCDVLEHIPVEFTMLVVAQCLRAAPRAFLHIAFAPDVFGAIIGQVLHLSAFPFVWWRDRLAELGRLTEARDLLGHGLFVVERA